MNAQKAQTDVNNSVQIQVGVTHAHVDQAIIWRLMDVAVLVSPLYALIDITHSQHY